MFFAQGDRYLDFVVTKVKPLDELRSVLYELTHLPSGAAVMHIACEDTENLFSLLFRTLPTSSNGVPHILEHTVLCGSRRFPVKDPFFAMQKRSLNTFMNAMTGADFTCYPAATQVEKDFYNLLDVYCDAVFHPLLKRASFLQEGHRLEFAEPDNPKTPLEIKGIVYNEMKGGMGSADARLWHAMLEALMPNLPYAFNSGGDPKEILNLTYAELIAFHEMYYHPSHCLFFFYGNFSLKKHLDFLSEKVLKHVQKTEPLPPLRKQERRKAPVRREISYPVSEGEEGTPMVSFGWLTYPIEAQEDVLALQLLDAILMETDASPLKRRLLDSGLCVRADAFLDVELSEIPYLIICKGCRPENADALEKLLFDELLDVAAQGIPAPLIEAAMHQLELGRLEIGGDHSPFGLTLFMRAALPKLHGCEPEFSLVVHALFERLLERIEDPQFFPALIRKTLLDNTHYARIIVRPDPLLAVREAQEEKERVDALHKALTPSQAKEIIKQTKEVYEYQRSAKTQSLDCLPSIGLQDVPLVAREFPLKEHGAPPFEVFHHDCFTNHLLYADLLFDVPEVTDDELPYLHLFATLLTEIGAGSRTYLEHLEYVQAHTGGVVAFFAPYFQVNHPSQAKPAFVLRGKSLERNVDKLLLLMRDILTQPKFENKERVQQLVQQTRVQLVQRLNNNALRYAVQLALSGLNQAGHIGESWQGLRYFRLIEELAKDIDKNCDALIDKLLALKEKFFAFQNMHLVLGGDKALIPTLEQHQYYELPTLAMQEHPLWQPHYPLSSPPSQGRIISSHVAFTVQTFPTHTYIHPHAPALALLGLLAENIELHAKIREEGGAYGCGATYLSSSGNFYFYSFRDPVIARTLSTFRHATEKLARQQFTQEDLNAAKLGVVQGLDAPIAPSGRASLSYSWRRDGKTHAMRQHFREGVLQVTPQQISQVAQELLDTQDKSVIVTFASKELLEQENAQLETPLPLYSI